MSIEIKRFTKLPEGTMHESAHGDWVPHSVVKAVIAQRDAFEKMAQMWKDHADSLRLEVGGLRVDARRWREFTHGINRVHDSGYDECVIRYDTSELAHMAVTDILNVLDTTATPEVPANAGGEP